MSTQTYTVLISGGSGSGKTTFAKALLKGLGKKNVQILYQDSYYIDQSAHFDKDGGNINFDHPKSIDFNLMFKQITDLKNGKTIQLPVYDFATHTRNKITKTVYPKSILIVDGTLLMSQQIIKELADYLIFVDCKEQLRFSRRLKRDTVERGRTKEGVRAQFFKQVVPMHKKFIENSKKFASITVQVDNFDKQITKVILHLQKIT